MPPLPMLRHRVDFDAVMRSGTARSHRILVLRWRHNDRAGTRVGFSTPRSLGGAVERNRVRRRLRQIVRERLGEIGNGYDLILIARRGAAEASYAELRTAATTLLERAGIGQ